MSSKSFLVVAMVLTILSSFVILEAQADESIGSCVWGGTNYVSDCNGECIRRGRRGGHCGSFLNNICWCET